ncbi:TRAP transporter small permease subunit [Kushneria aurantia]|uniref:TRAP transporter small permease protein n=1 Tax=Kushneria aurantia TaxID=504092 RepID=A0ABV6G530_9GAMM|nr:TRAP transporter small permease [Kushneria aurantia]
MTFTRFVSTLANRLVGLMLLAVVAFLLVEILIRKAGLGTLPGVHEYAGYVLAILSSWGLSQTLIERAHIRIDLGYSRLPRRLQCALDLISIAAVNLVGWLILLKAWPVLATSLHNGSLANTPLSTPLWIPQLIWLAGYGWFAFTASILALRSLAAAMAGDSATLSALIGMDSDKNAEATTIAPTSAHERGRH